MATIEGFPNYLIYPDGKVYNQKYDRFLKASLGNHGYLCLNLRKNNKTYLKSIHRLVGQAFIPNPENKPQIDHIDRDKSNNNVENLRWVNNSENQQNQDVKCTNKLGIKNICYNEGMNRYTFTKTINGNTHQKHLQTLDECIAYKETYLNNIV